MQTAVAASGYKFSSRASHGDATTDFCISLAPARLDRYLAAAPAMSRVPRAPFAGDTPASTAVDLMHRKLLMIEG
jgi:hypothetical protein